MNGYDLDSSTKHGVEIYGLKKLRRSHISPVIINKTLESGTKIPSGAEG